MTAPPSYIQPFFQQRRHIGHFEPVRKNLFRFVPATVNVVEPDAGIMASSAVRARLGFIADMMTASSAAPPAARRGTSALAAEVRLVVHQPSADPHRIPCGIQKVLGISKKTRLFEEEIAVPVSPQFFPCLFRSSQSRFCRFQLVSGQCPAVLPHQCHTFRCEPAFKHFSSPPCHYYFYISHGFHIIPPCRSPHMHGTAVPRTPGISL